MPPAPRQPPSPPGWEQLSGSGVLLLPCLPPHAARRAMAPGLPWLYLPVDRILVPLQGVVDSGSHAGRHDIGVRGVGSIVLAGV